MSDRRVFAYQILEYQLYFDRHMYSSWIDYYSYEYLWGYILRLLHDAWSIPADLIFSGISFLFISVCALILIKKHSPSSLALLINPLVVDVAFSQLRVALASALLGAAFLLSPKYNLLRVAFAAVALFVHSATPLFLAAYIVASLLAQRKALNPRAEALLLALTGIIIGLLIGPFRYDILSSFGDRRADYTDISSSLAFLLPWVVLFLAAIFVWPSLERTHEMRIALVILALVSTNVFTGGYSTRFLAICFPFLMSLLIGVNRRLAGLPLIAFICYSIYQWALWFQI